MKAREKGDSTWFGLPSWLALFLGVIAIAGVGFLLWLGVQAFNRSSTSDARRVRSLNIAADYIAKWPAVATTVGQSSLFHEEGDPAGEGEVFHAYLYHPEFGDFPIRYERRAAEQECTTGVRIDDNRLTVEGEALQAPTGVPGPESTYINRARRASWVPLNDGQRLCFTIADLDLGRVAPPLGSFSHLLLIKEPRQPEKTAPPATPSATDGANWRDGAVVAWVGPSELPIRSLSDLPALGTEVSRVLDATAQVYGAQTKSDDLKNRKTDALEPFNSRVAGKQYRFYWRPIVLDLPGTSRDAKQLDRYYLVGVAPTGRVSEPGQSRTQILTFGFALFLLISLMPVIKLALLGPVDTMKAIEVAAICLGIVAAAALGTAFWIGVQDVLVERTVAEKQVGAAALSLRKDIGEELRDVLFSPEMDEISKGLGSVPGDRLVVRPGPLARPSPPGKIAKVENLVLLDANGRQAAGTVMNAARDHVGANFKLSDRIYFRRAIDEDFAPGTPSLAQHRRSRQPCSIWNDIEEGLVFDQVRSRTDGAPKTIIAAKLKPPIRSLEQCGANFPARRADERLRPSVIVAAFVMQRMLVPVVHAGVRYAVLDTRAGASGRAVLFHSDSYRAGVEMFDESVDAATLAKLSARIGDPIDCKPPYTTSKPARHFSGTYEEEPTLFAVARVPCTDWAVVTFRSRQLLDAQAVKPAVHALLVWASLMIVPYFLWMVAALRWGDRAWVWLWPEPDPAKKQAYLLLAALLAGVTIVAFLLIDAATPFTSFLLSVAAALASLAWLFWVHYRQQIREWLARAPGKLASRLERQERSGLRKSMANLLRRAEDRLALVLRRESDRDAGKGQPAQSSAAGQEAPEIKQPTEFQATAEDAPEIKKPTKLDDATERRFIYFILALIAVLSVMPIAALAADARAYFTLTATADRESVQRIAEKDRRVLRNAIARMEGMETEPVNDEPPPHDQCSTPRYFTGDLREAASYDDPLPCKASAPTIWVFGFASLELMDNFVLASLALALLLIMGLAVWATTRGLFGFGVALEAVEYPELEVKEVVDEKSAAGFRLVATQEPVPATDKKPRKEWEITNDLPPRFLVIRANEKHLNALKRNAVELDLFEEITTGKERDLFAEIAALDKKLLSKGDEAEPPLVLVQNLGLVLGDPGNRQKALIRLEKILARQKAQPQHPRNDDRPSFRVAILTSLTPLERLLQSFERERDEHDQLDEATRLKARQDRAKFREDMRWSAVFEEFTTYFHAARPREEPPELKDQSDAVKFVWEELKYVSDAAVAAMIWDPKAPLLGKEIITWAREITKDCDRPRALVDFLASNLIEHYHLMWALSSREERLLLYRIAHGHVPNVAKAYSLRSLVKRGLVVLDPYPRTMNQSFAQFVQHVEKQDTIRNWRQKQEHGSWDVARLPITLALPVAVVLLVVASVRTGDSFAPIIPLIVAAGPALINALTSARRTAAA